MLLTQKSLYAVSRTRKSMKEMIQYDHVVRSAVFEGHPAKTSMENIVDLLKKDHIWTPSVQRLLRLMNGKRCEKCNGKQVRFVCRRFGVHFCTGCRRDSSISISRNPPQFPRSRKWEKALDHHRTAGVTGWYYLKLWNNVYVDSTSEKAGPLLCARLHFGNDTLLDNFLVGIEADDPNRIHRVRVLQTYAEYIDQAEQRLKLDRERLAAVWEEKEKKRSNKRSSRIRGMIDDLNVMLSDAPLKDAILALDHVHDDDDDIYSYHYPFQCYFMNQMLGTFLRAPSKVQRGKTKALVESTLLPALSGLDEFFRFTFLQDAISSSQSNLESSILICIKNYFSAQFPDSNQMMLHFKHEIDQDIIDFILSPVDQFAKKFAVLRALDYNGILNTLTSLLLSTAGFDETSTDYGLLCSLARKLIRGRSLPPIDLPCQPGSSVRGLTVFINAFEECTSSLPCLYQTAKHFLGAPETVEWVEGNPVKTIRRLKSLLFCTSSNSALNARVFDCLEKQDFTRLKETLLEYRSYISYSF